MFHLNIFLALAGFLLVEVHATPGIVPVGIGIRRIVTPLLFRRTLTNNQIRQFFPALTPEQSVIFDLEMEKLKQKEDAEDLENALFLTIRETFIKFRESHIKESHNACLNHVLNAYFLEPNALFRNSKPFEDNTLVASLRQKISAGNPLTVDEIKSKYFPNMTAAQLRMLKMEMDKLEKESDCPELLNTLRSQLEIHHYDCITKILPGIHTLDHCRTLFIEKYFTKLNAYFNPFKPGCYTLAQGLRYKQENLCERRERVYEQRAKALEIKPKESKLELITMENGNIDWVQSIIKNFFFPVEKESARKIDRRKPIIIYNDEDWDGIDFDGSNDYKSDIDYISSIKATYPGFVLPKRLMTQEELDTFIAVMECFRRKPDGDALQEQVYKQLMGCFNSYADPDVAKAQILEQNFRLQGMPGVRTIFFPRYWGRVPNIVEQLRADINKEQKGVRVRVPPLPPLKIGRYC